MKSLREKIIAFQNTAENEYKEKKSLSSVIKYFIAIILFYCSTLIAAITLPLRVVYKRLSKKKHTGIIIGNNDNIDKLLKSKKLILIDFWAEWCGPCLMMNSIIEEFAENTKDVQVVKVNADLNMKTLKRLNVRGLPHFLLMENGTEIKRCAGSMTRSDLNKFCLKD